MAKFEKGNTFGARGRPAGARNKLHADIIEAYAKDFAEHGPAVIQCMRIEKPVEWLRLAIQLLPKEVLFEDVSKVRELDDDELEAMISELRSRQSEHKREMN